MIYSKCGKIVTVDKTLYLAKFFRNEGEIKSLPHKSGNISSLDWPYKKC